MAQRHLKFRFEKFGIFSNLRGRTSIEFQSIAFHRPRPQWMENTRSDGQEWKTRGVMWSQLVYTQLRPQKMFKSGGLGKGRYDHRYLPIQQLATLWNNVTWNHIYWRRLITIRAGCSFVMDQDYPATLEVRCDITATWHHSYVTSEGLCLLHQFSELWGKCYYIIFWQLKIASHN